MDTYFEAPQYYTGSAPSIFLAGGISGTADWQTPVAQRLSQKAVVLNPRRQTYDLGNLTETPRQIKWEFDHLAKADVILFWFMPETLQPIAMFELGAYAYAGLHGKPLAVGSDPGYARRQDIVVQLGLARPDLVIFDSLDLVVEEAERLLDLV